MGVYLHSVALLAVENDRIVVVLGVDLNTEQRVIISFSVSIDGMSLGSCCISVNESNAVLVC